MLIITIRNIVISSFWNEKAVVLFIARVRVRASKNQLALARPGPWTVYHLPVSRQMESMMPHVSEQLGRHFYK